MTIFVNFVSRGHGCWSISRVTPRYDGTWLADVIRLSEN